MADRRQTKSKYTADRNIPGAFEGETVTRRRFMTGTANVAGIVAASAFLLPVVGFALGPQFELHNVHWQDVGLPDDFSKVTYVPKVITIVDGIGEAGKSTAYVRRFDPAIDHENALPPPYNRFIAVSTRCAHLGCPVHYVQAAQRFICPCHGGVYDFRGAVVGGPPVRPLDRFYTRVVKGIVQLGPRYSVNSEFQVFSPRDPGEPLDGIGQYLYPARPSVRKIPRDLMPKLPTPPLPPALKPPPKRPGEHDPPKKIHHHAADAGVAVVDWVDERTSLTGPVRWLLFRKVPKGTNWFYTLGSATMFAFISQAVTGVFLAMWYDPSPTHAYESIRYITNDAFLGEFVRGMHKWGSSVMVILIFLHMGRTFFFGAYKYPRELNWVIGVVLLILTMTMSFTGYLLPFDQRSYWASIVGININGTGPIVGPYLSDFLRAGPEFGATTLSRFYAIHMLLVPGLIAAMIGFHLYLVTKLGTTAPPWRKADADKALREERV